MPTRKQVALAAMQSGGLTASQIRDLFGYKTAAGAISIMRSIAASDFYLAELDQSCCPMVLRVYQIAAGDGVQKHSGGKNGRRGTPVVAIPTATWAKSCPGIMRFESMHQADVLGGYPRTGVSRSVRSGRPYAGYFWVLAEVYDAAHAAQGE